MDNQKISDIKKRFLDKFKEENKKMIKNSSKVWLKNEIKFRRFWKNKIMNKKIQKLSIEDMKSIIKILDAKASGKPKGAEVVATIGIRQGDWYRAFGYIKKSEALKDNFNKLFNTKKDKEQIKLLNNIKEICKKENIKYIGTERANIINAFMFVNNPEKNVSVVSLNDRYQLISFFKLGDTSEIMSSSFGDRIIKTRELIITLRKKFQLKTNRLLCHFFYFRQVESEWKQTDTPRPDYGDVINFKGFVYGPVNHEGVVALFGAVAEDLGFKIEKVRKEYPDIEAIHNGKKVNIEIEYLSSEFGNHDPKDCQIVVCWKKTGICPVKKVIELKEEIKRIKEKEIKK